jgi:hypothetical protein
MMDHHGPRTAQTLTIWDGNARREAHFRPSDQATSVRRSRQPGRLRSRHRVRVAVRELGRAHPQLRDPMHLSPADLGLVLLAIAVVVLRCPVARLVLISSTLGPRETARLTVELTRLVSRANAPASPTRPAARHRRRPGNGLKKPSNPNSSAALATRTTSS